MTNQQKLTQAILKYQPQVVRSIIETNADLDLNEALLGIDEAIYDVDKDGEDNIHARVQAIKEILQALVQNGADINSTNGDMNCILHASIHDPEIVNELIALGIDVNAVDDGGWTALTRACYRATPNSARNITVNMLLKAGANPNYASTEDLGEGFTPIMACAASPSTHASHELIPVLIAHGADIHAEDIDGFNALTYAAKSQNLIAAQMLVSYGAKMPTTNEAKAETLKYAQRSKNVSQNPFWDSVAKLT
jgi:ankyrin repeat/SAM/basic leucine zipper domain-containing protein 1